MCLTVGRPMPNLLSVTFLTLAIEPSLLSRTKPIVRIIVMVIMEVKIIIIIILLLIIIIIISISNNTKIQ